MEYRVLGRTGVMVSPLGLGTMNFMNPTSEDDAMRMINSALKAGINLIDTSNSYSAGESERIIGRTLQRALGNIKLSDLTALLHEDAQPRRHSNLVTSITLSPRRVQ